MAHPGNISRASWIPYLRPLPSALCFPLLHPQPDPAIVGTEEYEANLAKCREHLQVRGGGRVHQNKRVPARDTLVEYRAVPFW